MGKIKRDIPIMVHVQTPQNPGVRVICNTTPRITASTEFGSDNRYEIELLVNDNDFDFDLILRYHSEFFYVTNDKVFPEYIRMRDMENHSNIIFCVDTETGGGMRIMFTSNKIPSILFDKDEIDELLDDLNTKNKEMTLFNLNRDLNNGSLYIGIRLKLYNGNTTTTFFDSNDYVFYVNENNHIVLENIRSKLKGIAVLCDLIIMKKSNSSTNQTCEILNKMSLRKICEREMTFVFSDNDISEIYNFYNN